MILRLTRRRRKMTKNSCPHCLHSSVEPSGHISCEWLHRAHKAESELAEIKELHPTPTSLEVCGRVGSANEDLARQLKLEKEIPASVVRVIRALRESIQCCSCEGNCGGCQESVDALTDIQKHYGKMII